MSGDMLIVTGRENDGAFQSWDERTDFDTGVLSLDQGNDIDVPVNGSPSIFQEFVIFTAEGTGHTRIVFDLTWGGLIVRTIELDVYVN